MSRFIQSSLTFALVFVCLSAVTMAQSPTWFSPENLPPQLRHPLKLLATTAMSGEGKDFFSLKPGQTATIGTITGPAIIFRIWSTSSNTKLSSLDMIVDGKKETLVDRGRWSEEQWRKTSPLRSLDKQAYWSYVPVFVKKQAVFRAHSFEQGTNEPMKFYLQVGYRQVPATELAAAAKLDLKPIREELGQAYALEPSFWGNPATAAKGPLTLGKAWTVPVSGPAQVQCLALTVGDAATPEQLRATRLVVTCDGVRTIDAPVGALFGTGHRAAEKRRGWIPAIGTPVGDGALRLAFPMFFAQSMTVALEPFGKGALPSAEVAIHHMPLKQAPRYRLCAQYFSQLSVADQPMTLLNVTGEGIFVGTNLCVDGKDRKTFAFLEGNEQIYIDGGAKPTIEGTGTEDYFNNAWYFEAGEKANLFCGVTFKQDREPPMVDCYRYLVSDCIPFQKSFRFDLQHGSRNKAPDVLYEGVNFWYQVSPTNVAEPVAARAPAAGGAAGEPTEGGKIPLVRIVGFVLALAVVGFVTWWLLLKRKA
ncbi:DUF2961 domain-containing protein [bacterium]|nr:DUF2961 domain-containing protein [bacterium]